MDDILGGMMIAGVIAMCIFIVAIITFATTHNAAIHDAYTCEYLEKSDVTLFKPKFDDKVIEIDGNWCVE